MVGRRTRACVARAADAIAVSFFTASSTSGGARRVAGSETRIWSRLKSFANAPYCLPPLSPLYRLNTARPAAVPRPSASHSAFSSSSSSLTSSSRRRGIGRGVPRASRFGSKRLGTGHFREPFSSVGFASLWAWSVVEVVSFKTATSRRAPATLSDAADPPGPRARPRPALSARQTPAPALCSTPRSLEGPFASSEDRKKRVRDTLLWKAQWVAWRT